MFEFVNVLSFMLSIMVPTMLYYFTMCLSFLLGFNIRLYDINYLFMICACMVKCIIIMLLCVIVICYSIIL